MKCYNHNDRDALGISFTGKGLCSECLEEYKGYIIEKDSDLSKKRIDQLTITYDNMEKNQSIIQKSQSMVKFFGKLFTIAGLILISIGIILGIWFFIRFKNIFLGLFVGIFGIFTLLIGIGYNKKR